MRTFFQFMMRYRGAKQYKAESELAEWMFRDHAFPKHATSYHEISSYLEWNSPFPNALQLFDRLWEDYQEVED
ncbi:sterile alpha motif-like domain-containing protein [Radiobacillus kanasensis]|uniref:YozE family protein n=1 Tax=Radiobacillus kanasensis TaxID=2844358 RepID=UPI001E6482B2|nr:YozE family protein [Radiobacillus kanasensis]UFU01248.1 sterile alpha motif-like domain-containing protein [Radiobacillus kanasensis]